MTVRVERDNPQASDVVALMVDAHRFLRKVKSLGPRVLAHWVTVVLIASGDPNKFIVEHTFHIIEPVLDAIPQTSELRIAFRDDPPSDDV